MRHGMTKTKEYVAWISMKQRCYNSKNPGYKYYGAKGIKLCIRWKNNFLNFFDDMGIAPYGSSIHRIDSDKDYCLFNCEWIERGYHSIIHNRKELND